MLSESEFVFALNLNPDSIIEYPPNFTNSENHSRPKSLTASPLGLIVIDPLTLVLRDFAIFIFALRIRIIKSRKRIS